MNCFYWKEAKILIYAYIEHQTNLKQPISENIWYWVMFCPKCERELIEVKQKLYLEKGSTEYYKLRDEIGNYLYCESCKEVFHQDKVHHALSVFDIIATKFGYSKDCHGYHKQ